MINTKSWHWDGWDKGPGCSIWGPGCVGATLGNTGEQLRAAAKRRISSGPPPLTRLPLPAPQLWLERRCWVPHEKWNLKTQMMWLVGWANKRRPALTVDFLLPTTTSTMWDFSALDWSLFIKFPFLLSNSLTHRLQRNFVIHTFVLKLLETLELCGC